MMFSRTFAKFTFQFSVFSFVFFMLPSCVLYKPYQRPCLELPEHWRVTVDETSTIANIRWWKLLNDPVLDELINEALADNKDLRIATARVYQYWAQLGIVSSQLYPQFNGQGNFTRTRTSQTLGPDNPYSANNSDSAGNGSGLLAGLIPGFAQISPFSNDFRTVISAAYELDFFGRLQSATDASYAEYLSQIEARRTVILTLVSSLAAAYIQLRQYDMQLKISLQTVKSREYSYKLAELRFVEGITSELEVKQAGAELNEAYVQVIEFQNSIRLQENLISILIGHPPAFVERGLGIDEWTLTTHIPAGLPSDILEQRPDILQAEKLLIATNARIGEARALYFPNITLTGYYGYESGQLHELFTNPSKAWAWAANLLQPIFTGGRISSTVDLTKAQKQEAYYNYQQTILTALKEVDDSFTSHRNSIRALNVEFERTKDLKDALYLATLQYENGQVDYLNVLDAERRLFASQLDLAANQSLVFLTLVNIYKSLGGGWVVDAENIMQEELSDGDCLAKDKEC